MSEHYLSDLHWATKAVFGIPCPVCQGVMTIVQVEPGPRSGLEIHTLKCQACGPVRSETVDPRVGPSSAVYDVPTYFG
jgi:hypothetical protein